MNYEVCGTTQNIRDRKIANFRASSWLLWEKNNTAPDQTTTNFFKDGTVSGQKGIGQVHGGKGANMGWMDGHAGFLLYSDFNNAVADPNNPDLYDIYP